MGHLTDEQIQNYLDKKFIEDEEEIKNHLQQCESCRLNLTAYKKVYHILKAETVPELSHTFLKSTIDRIENPRERKWSIFENVIIAAMLIVSLFISFYFLGQSNILSDFEGIDFSFITSITNNIFSTISPNFMYIVAALLIAITIEFLDRLRFQQFLK